MQDKLAGYKDEVTSQLEACTQENPPLNNIQPKDEPQLVIEVCKNSRRIIFGDGVQNDTIIKLVYDILDEFEKCEQSVTFSVMIRKDVG